MDLTVPFWKGQNCPPQLSPPVQLCPGVLQKQQGFLSKKSNPLNSEQAHWEAPSRCLQLQMLLEGTPGEDFKGGRRGWVGQPEQMCLE